MTMPQAPKPAAKVIWAMAPMEGGMPFFMTLRGPWYTQMAAISSPAPLSKRQLQQPPNSGRGEAEPGSATRTSPGAASARCGDMVAPEEAPEMSVVYKSPLVLARKSSAQR